MYRPFRRLRSYLADQIEVSLIAKNSDGVSEAMKRAACRPMRGQTAWRIESRCIIHQRDEPAAWAACLECQLMNQASKPDAEAAASAAALLYASPSTHLVLPCAG